MYTTMGSDLWDFIMTVPAVKLDECSCVVPTLYDSTIVSGMYWSVFGIALQTNDNQVYFSDPDSGYSVDNLPPHAPPNLLGQSVPGGVSLIWSPPPDSDLIGYHIYRGVTPEFNPSPSTMSGSSARTMYLDAFSGAGEECYCVTAVDRSGNVGSPSTKLGVIVATVENEGELPSVFALSQNFPNPFNPTTLITYDIPVSSSGLVRLTVYDVLGRLARTLVDEQKAPGRYAVRFDALNLASGVYICRLDGGSTRIFRKMILTK